MNITARQSGPSVLVLLCLLLLMHTVLHYTRVASRQLINFTCDASHAAIQGEGLCLLLLNVRMYVGGVMRCWALVACGDVRGSSFDAPIYRNRLLEAVGSE